MRRTNRRENLTPEEARALLDGAFPPASETTAHQDKETKHWWRIQQAMMKGPHARELAQTYTDSHLAGAAGDAAFKRHLQILRLIVIEEAPELLEQLRQETESGRFHEKRDAIRKKTDDQSN